MRPRIGFASGRNIGMSDDVLNRVSAAQALRQHCQRSILRVGEGFGIAAFQLDSNREIVASLSALPA
jgi:hypothetical protein